jgi:putative DNA primase/helicase
MARLPKPLTKDDYLKPGKKREAQRESVTLGIKAPTSIGKTEIVLRHIPTEIARMRAAGDKRVIVIAVPTHRLSGDLLRRARDKGISTEVWRGPERQDIDGEPMCKDLKLMRDARAVLADPCPACPLRRDCRYIAQRLKKADLWIVAHASLFHDAPKPIGDKGVALLIVDETAWPSAIKDEYELPLDQLDPGFMPIGKGSDGDRLADIRAYLQSACEPLADGQHITRAHLVAKGFDSTTGRFGVRQEWKRLVSGEVGDERLEANRSILAMVQVWEAVGALFTAPGDSRASGWLKVTRRQDRVRVLSISGRKPVSQDFSVPTLLIDADLDPTLSKLIWPNLEIISDIKVDAPHQMVIQAADRVWSNDFLAENGVVNPLRVNQLRALVAALALITGKKVLFIGPKKIAEEIVDVHPKVGVGWFNGIAGRDEWRGTPTTVSAGRNQPPHAAVEEVAEALTGWELSQKVQGDFYPLRDSTRYVRQTDGSIAIRMTQTHGHPDPIAEAVRRRICEGEGAQAMGRPRGLLATAAEPVTIIVIGDVPHEFPVDRFVSSHEILNPPAWARMYGESGVILTQPEHMIRAFKKFWSVPETARKALALDRDRTDWPFGLSSWRQTGKISYKSLTTENDQFDAVSSLVRVKYRLAADSTSTTALFDRDKSDPRGWLEQALGPVSEFEIVDQSSRSMVVIQPGQRASVAAYARLHGLTAKAAESRMRRNPELREEWQHTWDQKANWPEYRVRLGRYSLIARVEPQASPQEILGTLGFEVVEIKPEPVRPSAYRPLSTPVALGGRRGLVHSVFSRRSGALSIPNRRVHRC